MQVAYEGGRKKTMLRMTGFWPWIWKVDVISANATAGQEKIHQWASIHSDHAQVAQRGARGARLKQLHKRQRKFDRQEIAVRRCGGSRNDEIAAARADLDL